MNHGIYAYRVHRCRCDECRLANNEMQRRYRARIHGTPEGERVAAGRRNSERRFREDRRAQSDTLKLAAGCMDCGYRAHPHALEFDHRPGTEKLFTVAKEMGSRRKTWPELLAEIEKCDVVCANCHRIRTASRRAA